MSTGSRQESEDPGMAQQRAQQRKFVSDFAKELKIGDTVTAEWSLLEPEGDPADEGREWSLWTGTAATLDPIAIDWDAARSRGTAVDEEANPQPFPGEAEGAIVWYRLLKARKKPVLIQRHAEEPPAKLPRVELADALLDAQKGGKTRQIAENLRVPTEVGELEVWAPDRWLDRGDAWEKAFFEWRRNMLSTLSTAGALELTRKARITRQVFKAVANNPQRADCEALFYLFVELAEICIPEHAETIRKKFTTAWSEGRIDLPAIILAALHAPATKQREDTPENKDESKANYRGTKGGRGGGGGRGGNQQTTYQNQRRGGQGRGGGQYRTKF